MSFEQARENIRAKEASAENMGAESGAELGLRAKNLVVERGGRAIIRDLSFALAPGRALAVVGPNGSGKSTLLRALAGLLPLSGGRLTLEGADEDIQTRMHYVGHADALKPALTSLENLTFWRDLLGGGAGALAPSAALEKLGLAHAADIACAYLSAGQKRRVALGRLLVAWRPLWLLDEPTTALDGRAQENFAHLMRAHLESGGMIAAATHAPLGLEVERLALGGKSREIAA